LNCSSAFVVAFAALILYMNTLVKFPEVKLKSDHINKNTGASGQPPLVEPITAEVVSRMEQNTEDAEVVVETTKASTQS
jgi:dihydroorotate dehydrogenase